VFRLNAEREVVAAGDEDVHHAAGLTVGVRQEHKAAAGGVVQPLVKAGVVRGGVGPVERDPAGLGHVHDEIGVLKDAGAGIGAHENERGGRVRVHVAVAVGVEEPVGGGVVAREIGGGHSGERGAGGK